MSTKLLRTAAKELLENRDDFRYRQAMERLLKLAGRDAPLSWVLEPGNVRMFLEDIRSRGLSPASERREAAAISVLIREQYNDFERNRVFGQIKMRPLPKRGPPRYLSEADQELLRNQCFEEDWNPYALLVLILLATGIRRSELLRLRKGDFDSFHGIIRIHGGKSHAARRSQPLPWPITQWLKKWLVGKDQDDLIFPFSKMSVHHHWKQIQERAGLSKDYRLHDLRHTYGAMNASAGMPLFELKARMGHAKIATTERYAVFSPDVRTPASEKGARAMGFDNNGG